MSIVTFPLNNTDYTADDMALYFSNRTNGVFSADGELSVISNNNMTVTVKAGRAWLAPDTMKGYIFANMSDKLLTVSIADGVLNRIDRVVIKYDIVANESTLYVKKGTPNTNPIAPVLTRDKNVAWELAIADIYVGKGVTMVKPTDITDKRLDSSVCGLVSDGINKIATDVLYNQFMDWFLHLRNELDENQVTNLQAQIDTWNNFKTNGGEIGGLIATNGIANKTGETFVNISANKERIILINTDTDKAFRPWTNGYFSLGQSFSTWKDIYLTGVSKSANGYTKLPNGMIMQWGELTSPSNVSSSFTFPISFPTIGLHIFGTMVNTSANISNIGVGAIIRADLGSGKTHGQIIHNSGGDKIIRWIAIGY